MTALLKESFNGARPSLCNPEVHSRYGEEYSQIHVSRRDEEINERDNPEDPIFEFQGKLLNVTAKAKTVFQQAVDSSEKLGYVYDAAKYQERTYCAILNGSQTHEQKEELARFGSRLADNLITQLSEIEISGSLLGESVYSLVSSTASATASAYMVAVVVDEQSAVTRPADCPFLPSTDMQHYAEKLEHLDTSLANTYREAWSSYYTDIKDPKRFSLFGLRQVFDHLLEFLASDDEVRASEFWTEKPKHQKNKVFRRERILFAANRWIQKPAERSIQIEAVDKLLDSYNELNVLHTQGELSPSRTEEAFFAFDLILRRWIDAIAV